ncbi:hypothetical protein [Luteimonas aquatica]|uniref:hypothetical protein n=1 Tax=Luteimonas aquatica TaxID=450364 RepID=UPI001F5659D2|nr:hypothetical protein [Luteimonas aquatica]
MNTNAPGQGPDQEGMPDALRLQLRGLRRDVPPQRDLWTGIGARIAQMPAGARQAPPSRWSLRAPRMRVAALAASVSFAFALAWQLRPASDAPPAPVAAAGPAAATISREAASMTEQYHTALRQIDLPELAATDADALHQLDAGAAQVRQALARDPDARFLLRQLQKLYTQRLALTQRFALG